MIQDDPEFDRALAHANEKAAADAMRGSRGVSQFRLEFRRLMRVLDFIEAPPEFREGYRRGVESRRRALEAKQSFAR